MNNDQYRRNEIRLLDRLSFAREWLADARDQQSERRVFSAFFAGYVALVAAATQIAGDHNEFKKYCSESDDDFERKAIEFAMCQKAIEINQFVKSEDGKRATASLRSREVPEGEKFKIIGSVDDADLAHAVAFLYELWSPLSDPLKSKEAVKAQAMHLANVFRKIRNRLFHGGKLNDPHGSDSDLLERVNPVLFGVVEAVLAH